MLQLPLDLLADSLRAIGDCESLRFGGVCGRTEGMRAHMRNRCGLPRCSSSRDRAQSAHRTSASTPVEATADLAGDVKLAPCEATRASDGLARAAVLRSF